MATKAEKKEVIRQEIIASASVYSSVLAGKNFLYVYGEEYFEVSFPADRFLHLTGVETTLSARDFLQKLKKGNVDEFTILFFKQISFCKCKKEITMFEKVA